MGLRIALESKIIKVDHSGVYRDATQLGFFAVLTSVTLDQFRGKFIPPAEAKNVLQPMECALAQKRGIL